MVFAWDEKKNKANIKKHGIAFETAVRVFNDYNLLEVYDSEHSTPDEERWIVLGLVADILCVVFSERNETIRIISARKATKGEINEYYKNHDNR